MKVVILAGGFGTRLLDEGHTKPKPMVEIGGYPILWHILKHYSTFAFKEFYLALGYKSEVVKRYFLDYYILNRSITINLSNGNVEVHQRDSEDWLVHLVDSGLTTNTGGRILRMRKELEKETFMLTYGDGVSNIDLHRLLNFHRSEGKIATISAVRPPSRFGGLTFDGNLINEFTEKPQIGEGWINGGFAVFEPEIFNYLSNDETSLEADALEQLAHDKQLAAFKHDGFWQCMDTPRDLRLLETLWQSQTPPWKIWE